MISVKRFLLFIKNKSWNLSKFDGIALFLHFFMTLIKSISGIRGTLGGVSGENLTPIDVVKYTSAYASMLLQRKKAKSGSR